MRQEGLIQAFHYPVTVWDLDEESWHHNPSIARDPTTGKIWVATRYHQERPATRYANPFPYSHPTSWLMLGILDEDTLKVSEVRRIESDPDNPDYIRDKEVEDVRIFHRPDGLHGIGVAINSHSFPGETRVYEVEILIDPISNTYKLLKDYGYDLKGHMEKNWTPPTTLTPQFDYIYSQTEVVKGDKVLGTPCNGQTHGGSQALPYKDGWLRIAHRVVGMGVTHRWYISQAELLDKDGYVTHTSQFFDLCTGWRPQIKESVEFISGAVWSKGKEGKELLVSYGIRDETCGFVKIPMDLFRWEPFDSAIEYTGYRFSDHELPTYDKYWIGEKFGTAALAPTIVMYKRPERAISV